MVIPAKQMQIERLSKLHREGNSFSFDASSSPTFYLTFFLFSPRSLCILPFFFFFFFARKSFNNSNWLRRAIKSLENIVSLPSYRIANYLNYKNHEQKIISLIKKHWHSRVTPTRLSLCTLAKQQGVARTSHGRCSIVRTRIPNNTWINQNFYRGGYKVTRFIQGERRSTESLDGEENKRGGIAWPV